MTADTPSPRLHALASAIAAVALTAAGPPAHANVTVNWTVAPGNQKIPFEYDSSEVIYDFEFQPASSFRFIVGDQHADSAPVVSGLGPAWSSVVQTETATEFEVRLEHLLPGTTVFKPAFHGNLRPVPKGGGGGGGTMPIYPWSGVAQDDDQFHIEPYIGYIDARRTESSATFTAVSGGVPVSVNWSVSSTDVLLSNTTGPTTTASLAAPLTAGAVYEIRATLGGGGEIITSTSTSSGLTDTAKLHAIHLSLEVEIAPEGEREGALHVPPSALEADGQPGSLVVPVGQPRLRYKVKATPADPPEHDVCLTWSGTGEVRVTDLDGDPLEETSWRPADLPVTVAVTPLEAGLVTFMVSSAEPSGEAEPRLYTLDIFDLDAVVNLLPETGAIEVDDAVEAAPGVGFWPGRTALRVKSGGTCDLVLSFPAGTYEAGGKTSPVTISSFPATGSVTEAGGGDALFELTHPESGRKDVVKLTEDAFAMLFPLNTLTQQRGLCSFGASTAGSLSVAFRLWYNGSDDVKLQLRNMEGPAFPVIDGSTQSWEEAGPGLTGEGKRSADAGKPEYTEKAIFDGLPASNDQFGKKLVRVSVPADGFTYDEQHIKVFYNGAAKNHPGPDHGVTPNWYYYWKQFLPDMDKFEYKAGAFAGEYLDKGTETMDDDELFLADEAPLKGHSVSAVWHNAKERNNADEFRTHKVGQYGSGIDCCAVTIAHELQHRENRRRIVDAGKADTDEDGLCDEDELAFGTEIGSTDSWLMQNIPGLSAATRNVYRLRGDDEYAARKAEGGISANAYHCRDWSSVLSTSAFTGIAVGKQYSTLAWEDF